MSENKSGKRRWTDPIVLIPLILIPIVTAFIAAFPDYLEVFQPTTKTTPSPPPEPTPSAANITVATDEESYTIGEVVTISGNVSKPESGKSLRIYAYNPTDDILSFANGMKVYPNGKGFYTMK